MSFCDFYIVKSWLQNMDGTVIRRDGYSGCKMRTARLFEGTVSDKKSENIFFSTNRQISMQVQTIQTNDPSIIYCLYNHFIEYNHQK
jgi:hypothetical protein